MFVTDLFIAVVVRLVLMVHSLLVIWLAASMTHHHEYWVLCLAQIGMVVEAGVTFCKNKAQEWKWFCPCFFFYLCSTIPGIWLLELNRMNAYQEKQDSINTTALRMEKVLDDIEGVNIPIEMETNTLVIIMEQLFLYLMILARWILPRGEITRNELSQLLFVFIGIASDITELFALFEEDKVREDTRLTYAILCIWTISLFQFTFVLTSTHSPKKVRVAVATRVDVDDLEEIETDQEESENLLKSFFQTEVWSIFVNFFLQDGPFLAVRLYTMINLKLVTYSIIFFTAKNGLLVMLLVYRLAVLCCERKKKKETPSSPQPSPSLSSKQNANVSNASEQSLNSARKKNSVESIKHRGSKVSLESNGSKVESNGSKVETGNAVS